jgi:DNA-binding NarL/FixJ family response regulator
MRVFVADRSTAVLERLTAILDDVPTVEIVGHSSDAAGALGAVRQLDLEVVILDARLLGGDGVELLKSFKRQNPATVVVVLTSFDHPQYRVRLQRAGADILLDKSDEFARLPQLLRELAEVHGDGNHLSCPLPTGSS